MIQSVIIGQLDSPDRMEVMTMWMASVWDWMVEIFMKDNSTERVRQWTMENPERRREQNRKSAKAYYERNIGDPEYVEKRRKQKAASARKHYTPVSEMTPEELEEIRAYRREAARKYRERKKLEQAMLKVQKGE